MKLLKEYPRFNILPRLPSGWSICSGFEDIPKGLLAAVFSGNLRNGREFRELHDFKQPERYRLKAKQNRLKRKLGIFTHYGGNPPRCSCCSESNMEFLTIHHINGGGLKHFKEIGGVSKFYGWLEKNNYPEGFSVLCMNCNFAIGHFGGCPHQREQDNRIKIRGPNFFDGIGILSVGLEPIDPHPNSPFVTSIAERGNYRGVFVF